MSGRDETGLLGPVGAAALDRARRALAELGEDGAGARLRVAGWTIADWAFRFELPPGGRQLVIQVPHDGGPTSVREGGTGPDPLNPAGGAPA